MSEKRKAAIKRRRIFLSLCAIILVLVITLLSLGITLVIKAVSRRKQKNIVPPVNNSSSVEKTPEDYIPNTVTYGEYTLDTNFSRTLLVNADNPLPDVYDEKIREYLVEIDEEYRNNDYVTKIHKDVLPYISAMVAEAQKDNVQLQVWSPFRSYAIQRDLFERQVARCGGDEDKAATTVSRPGTSEHNTGLCADFNMADDKFEDTEMFEWMCEHAEDFGFILRYPKDKMDVTGVIYESWHWRFVGIKTAKEINRLGMTLEEYVEHKRLNNNSELAFLK